jgi:hypothetical protein
LVDLGISEFTFGFAFLHEQANRSWSSLRGVPLLPNLQEETNVGWDAMIPTRGKNYYYQFKLSDFLVRGNAKYIFNGRYRGPYFRIKLHKFNFNHQHRILWEHAKQFGNEHTYYVAPETFSQSQFKNAYLNHNLSDYSRLIPLRSCRNYLPNDEEQHYITYQRNNSGFLQHSEIHIGEGSFSGKEIGEVYKQSRKDFRPIDNKYADDMIKSTVNSLDKLLKSDYRAEIELLLEKNTPEERISKLLYASELLLTGFGVYTAIVGEKESNEKYSPI